MLRVIVLQHDNQQITISISVLLKLSFIEEQRNFQQIIDNEKAFYVFK